MAEDKEKIELKPEPKKSDNLSEEKLVEKKPKKLSNPKKKILSVSALVFLVILLLGAGVFLTYKFVVNKSEVSTDEVELTRTEELEMYKLPEGADQDMINSDLLVKANAYYDEQNYEKVLELLEAVSEPSETATTSLNGLYARTYEIMGNQEMATKYYVIVLGKFEAQLLDNAKSMPAERFGLAELYEKAGQINSAIEHYEILASIEGTQEELSAGEYDLYEIREASKEALQRLQ